MAASAASGSAFGSHKQHGANQQAQTPYNQLKVITVDKHFLISNRSSHTSAFSAIAELVDNAKDAGASQCSIQITELEDNAGPVLIMMDTGKGMTVQNLELAFGFGHNIKPDHGTNKMIGWAGNGLKSSSMYLGKDLIVFTKTKSTQSIGLLSQTFLEETGMSEVRVPLVSWDLQGNPLQASEAHTEQSMEAITRFSPYTDNEQCLSQLSFIDNTGTIIMIMKLEGYKDSRYQLDWQTDERDVLIPDAEDEEIQKDAPRTVHNSLRKFLSLLYEDPKMQILIGSHRVRTQRVCAELRDLIGYSYKPAELPADFDGLRNVRIEVGFWRDPEDWQPTWSALLYWRKRLIVPFLRFPEPGRAAIDEHKRKAVAVVNCDYLTPTHNKGSFLNPDNHYTKLRHQIHARLRDFWVARVEAPAEHNRALLLRKGSNREPEKFEYSAWVQCCEPFCLKWRRLPEGDSAADPKYEDDWYCDMNPNKELARLGHDYAQELDEDLEEERREQDQARKRAADYTKRKKEQSASATTAKRRKLEEEKAIRAAEAEEAQRRERDRKEAERRVREEARLARLERERQQQEAERAARQEAQRVAKEQLREKARAAKEKAERKLQQQREREKREAAARRQREQQQAAARQMKEEADARREAGLAARERDKAAAAERQAQREAAAHAAQEQAKAEAAAERERRAQERQRREAGDVAIALSKSQKEAARLQRTGQPSAGPEDTAAVAAEAAATAADDTAAADAAEAAAREAEAQHLQQIEAALAELDGSEASVDDAAPDAAPDGAGTAAPPVPQQGSAPAKSAAAGAAAQPVPHKSSVDPEAAPAESSGAEAATQPLPHKSSVPPEAATAESSGPEAAAYPTPHRTDEQPAAAFEAPATPSRAQPDGVSRAAPQTGTTSPVLDATASDSGVAKAIPTQRNAGGTAPPAAQPTASGTPAANALLALAASNASPSHLAEAVAADANGANDAAAGSSGDVPDAAGEEAQQLDGIVQQLRRQWQQATGNTPSTVDKGLARVSAGLASMAKQQQRERRRVAALAARMRAVLAALSRAAGDTQEAQRLEGLGPDELSQLDVQSYAAGFVPSPQRSAGRARQG